MADTAAVELMREGLTNYLDARYALGVFEQRIQESAKKVLNAHLAELKEALQAEKNDIWVERAEPCELERVVLGAAFYWDWGLRLGIAWRDLGDKPQLAGCLSIRTSANARMMNGFRALQRALPLPTQPDLIVDYSKKAPWEIFVYMPLAVTSSGDEILMAMDTLLTSFLELSKKAGGLNNAMWPSQGEQPADIQES
jgi:hypothetical protein